MKVSVIGCGRWGTFLAWYMNYIKNEVTLYGRETSERYLELKNSRKNAYLELSPNIKLVSKIEEALENDYIFISINAQNLRAFMESISNYELNNKNLILCMKGLEQETGKRLSEVAGEYVTNKTSIAIWAGPGHIQDFVNEIPNCMIIDSLDNTLKNNLIDILSSNLIRFYIGTDIIGNEIGAALKNVYGIAAGMLDALGFGSLKGALIVRSSVEVAHFVEMLGGNNRSIYGLSFLGECETTFFSKFSNNRLYGENFIKKQKTDKICEGVHTLYAVKYISDKMGIEMPICNSIYKIINDGMDADTVFSKLFLRSIKEEFWR